MLGKIIPFPIQSRIHWNGRHLTYEELNYVREFLISVSRRIRIKRLSFSGIDFQDNDIKVIIDQLSQQKVILDEEKERVYLKLHWE